MILFDIETTDLVGPDGLPIEKQPQVVEFSAVKLDDKTLVQKGVIDFLINPGVPLQPKIQKITGLTDDDLRDKPPFRGVYPQIAEFFLGEKIMVAHNLDFDEKMLEFELRRLGKLTQFPWPMKHICTVELTHHIKGYRLKLQELYELATKGGKFHNAHRAMNDVKALATIVRWARKEKLL